MNVDLFRRICASTFILIMGLVAALPYQHPPGAAPIPTSGDGAPITPLSALPVEMSSPTASPQTVVASVPQESIQAPRVSIGLGQGPAIAGVAPVVGPGDALVEGIAATRPQPVSTPTVTRHSHIGGLWRNPPTLLANDNGQAGGAPRLAHGTARRDDNAPLLDPEQPARPILDHQETQERAGVAPAPELLGPRPSEIASPSPPPMLVEFPSNRGAPVLGGSVLGARSPATATQPMAPSLAPSLAPYSLQAVPGQRVGASGMSGAIGANSANRANGSLMSGAPTLQGRRPSNLESHRVRAVSRPQLRRYVIRDGDTLANIAERMLGDARRGAEIFQLNRDRLRSPRILPLGMEIRVPPRDVPVSADGMAPVYLPE